MNNLQIRQQIIQQRQDLSDAAIEQASILATECLVSSEVFLRAKHIACYLPVRGEMDTQYLIQAIERCAKHCYLPVLNPLDAEQMYFVKYQQGDILIANQFGILEPQLSTAPIQASFLDLVIMPLVAFDKKGNRLGSGCGYYDRTFAGINTWIKKPTLCGFAFDFQENDHFKKEAWDVPMHLTASSKLITFAHA